MAEGVYRFGTSRINWYLLEADDGLTVVDAGLPAHWPQLGDWLDENGHELDDVAALVLTHADVDHVGFASTLADRGVPVYGHPDDLPSSVATHRAPPDGSCGISGGQDSSSSRSRRSATASGRSSRSPMPNRSPTGTSSPCRANRA